MMSEFLQTGSEDGHHYSRRRAWLEFKRGPILSLLILAALGAIISGGALLFLLIKG